MTSYARMFKLNQGDDAPIIFRLNIYVDLKGGKWYRGHQMASFLGVGKYEDFITLTEFKDIAPIEGWYHLSDIEFINEKDLCLLIMRSSKPWVDEFCNWFINDDPSTHVPDENVLEEMLELKKRRIHEQHHRKRLFRFVYPGCNTKGEVSINEYIDMEGKKWFRLYDFAGRFGYENREENVLNVVRQVKGKYISWIKENSYLSLTYYVDEEDFSMLMEFSEVPWMVHFRRWFKVDNAFTKNVLCKKLYIKLRIFRYFNTETKNDAEFRVLSHIDVDGKKWYRVDKFARFLGHQIRDFGHMRQWRDIRCIQKGCYEASLEFIEEKHLIFMIDHSKKDWSAAFKTWFQNDDDSIPEEIPGLDIENLDPEPSSDCDYCLAVGEFEDDDDEDKPTPDVKN